MKTSFLYGELTGPLLVLALLLKRKVENGQLVLKHPLEGDCSFKLSEPDAQALYDLLNDQSVYKGKKFHLERDGLLTPGFKIILEDYRNQGQKSEAIKAIRPY